MTDTIAGVAGAVAAASWSATLRFVQSIAHRAIEGGLVITVAVLSWNAFWWAFAYAAAALAATQDAVGTAAVLAAILGPLATLQGFTLARYIAGSNKESA